MSDDFQAMPPGLPPHKGLPPAYDRFGEVDVRQPEVGNSIWWRTPLVAFGLGVGLLVYLAFQVDTDKARKTFATVGTATVAFDKSGSPFGAPGLPKPLLEGSWVAAAVTIDGRTAIEEEKAKVKVTIDADGFVMVLPYSAYNGTIALMPSLNHENINFVVRDSPDIKAIYQVNEDTLTICMSLDPRERPTDFTSRKDSGHILLVMKRQGKEP